MKNSPISFILEENKYIFELEEEYINKKIGEVTIKISEINASDILKIVQDYPHLSDKVTERNFFKFVEWIFKQLSNKYDFLISFFIREAFIPYFLSYKNEKENFIEQINILNNPPEIMSKTAKIRLDAELINEFDKNMKNFIGIISIFIYQELIMYKRIVKTFVLEDNLYSEGFSMLINYYFHEGINYKLKINEKNKIIEEYSTANILSILMFDICNLMKREIKIKQCANCNAYFIPPNRSDTIYCDRRAPQDNTKNCQEYGSYKAWSDNLKTDEAAKKHRNTYMKLQLLVKRNPAIIEYKNKFEEYKTLSKKWKTDVKNGVKSKDEYLNWISTY